MLIVLQWREGGGTVFVYHVGVSWMVRVTRGTPPPMPPALTCAVGAQTGACEEAYSPPPRERPLSALPAQFAMLCTTAIASQALSGRRLPLYRYTLISALSCKCHSGNPILGIPLHPSRGSRCGNLLLQLIHYTCWQKLWSQGRNDAKCKSCSST